MVEIVRSIRRIMTEMRDYMRYALIAIFVIMFIAIIVNFTIRFFARKSIFAQIKEKGIGDSEVVSMGFGISMLKGARGIAVTESDKDGFLQVKFGKIVLDVVSSENKHLGVGTRVAIYKVDPNDGIIVKRKEKNELRKIYHSLKD